MIVYGDRKRREPSSAAIERVRSLVATPCDEPTHTAELAIECGMLAQGLLDAEFEVRRHDELTPLTSACAELCAAAARAFLGAPRALVERALDRCAARISERDLSVSEPEGYAFYALYPELYIAAARALAPRLAGEETQVIGIRSIGTSLAGFVAAAVGSTRLPYTVRPTGHPFARLLHVGERLESALLAQAARTHYLVVDEGPGMSGTSFLAVARFLLARGVPEDRITLLPSHAGPPGARSNDEGRALYARLRKSVVSLEEVFDAATLGRWFVEHTGELSEPPRDVAGGRWRALVYPHPRRWPASHVRDERRKYLLSGDETWLMKFVGLGACGEELAARARTLSRGGFTPEFEAYRHGFMLSRWRDDALPLPLATVDRGRLVEQVARYLSFLAVSFPARAEDCGASPPALFELLRHNTDELLGREVAGSLERYAPLLSTLSASHRPTATDNKLDAHEWLVCDDGSLRKCDAEGHHRAHDCIGAQDPAWDVAGATIELALTADEREPILRALRDRAGLRLDPPKLRFYELAYLAFRAGHAHYAEQALATAAPEDAARFQRERERYCARLARSLQAEPITSAAP